MNDFLADYLIDLALELYGEDFTEEQLDALAEEYCSRWDWPHRAWFFQKIGAAAPECESEVIFRPSCEKNLKNFSPKGLVFVTGGAPIIQCEIDAVKYFLAARLKKFAQRVFAKRGANCTVPIRFCQVLFWVIVPKN